MTNVRVTFDLTISGLLKVYVGISQRPACDDVSAHTDGHDGSSSRELLVQHGLGDVSVQVSYVQRGQRIGQPAVHPDSQLRHKTNKQTNKT